MAARPARPPALNALIAWALVGLAGYLLWIPARAVSALLGSARPADAELLRALLHAWLAPLSLEGPLAALAQPLPPGTELPVQLLLYNVPLALALAGYFGGIRVLTRRGAPDHGTTGQGALEPDARRALRRAVLGAAALYALAALFIYPSTVDAWYYLSNGRAWALYGANPYLQPASTVPDDSPIARLNADPNVSPMPHTYGPAWLAFSGALARIAGDNPWSGLLLLKLALVGFAALGLWAVDRGLQPAAPEARPLGLLLYAWNPLLLFIGVGGAHNDVALAGLGVAGLVWLSRADALRGLGGLVLAGLVKYASWPYALAGLSSYPWSEPRRRVAGLAGAAAALLLGVLFFAPFWAGPAMFRGLELQLGQWGGTPLSMLILALDYFPDADRSVWHPLIGWFGLAALVVLAAGAVIRLRDRPPAERAALLALQLTLLFFYVANRRFLSWYAIWLVPPLALCAFSRRWRLVGVLFTLTVLLSANIYVAVLAGGPDLRLWAVYAIYLVPLLGLAAPHSAPVAAAEPAAAPG